MPAVFKKVRRRMTPTGAEVLLSERLSPDVAQVQSAVQNFGCAAGLRCTKVGQRKENVRLWGEKEGNELFKAYPTRYSEFT